MGLRCDLFLALGDGDNVAVVFVFEGVIRFGFSIGETFNHADMVTENILDGDESEDEEYA